MNTHTLVVGGGITGLAAALALKSRGIAVHLLEASPRLGGIIRTEQVDGFTIEAGPDSMLVQKPAALELCHELDLGARLISTRLPRTAYVLKRGALYPLPPNSVLGLPPNWRALAGYALLPWHARARVALERVIPPHPVADESVGRFFRRRFGSASVSHIAEPLLGGIHAGDIEALSIRSLVPRFSEAESREGSVLRSVAARHTPVAGGMFRSLASGMEELVRAIEGKLTRTAIDCDAPVDRIRRAGDGWSVMSGGREFTSRALVLAVPAFVAARLLADIDPAAAALCARVPYVSTVSVALAWPRARVAHPLAGTGFVVARRYNDLRITACTWVSSKWLGRAPEEWVLLRAYLGGSHDPAAVDLADDEIVALAAGELAPILGIGGPPALAKVYRWRRAGAQHVVGHLDRVQQVESCLARHPRLFVAGSGFRAVGIPDCIADGKAVAAKIHEMGNGKG